MIIVALPPFKRGDAVGSGTSILVRQIARRVSGVLAVVLGNVAFRKETAGLG